MEVLLIITSILIHELGHAAVARMLGVNVMEVELLPFGGQAKIEDFTGLDPEKEIYVAAAGPVISLSLAAFLWMAVPECSSMMTLFIRLNLFLGIFNLLPALPLDGGRILRSILSKILGYRHATRSMAAIGQVLAVGLVAGGGYLTYHEYSGANVIVIGILLFWAARREGNLLAYAFMRFLVKKKGELARHGFMEGKQMVASPDTLVKNILNQSRPSYYMTVMMIDTNGSILGVRSEAELIEGLLEGGPTIKVKDC